MHIFVTENFKRNINIQLILLAHVHWSVYLMLNFFSFSLPLLILLEVKANLYVHV